MEYLYIIQEGDNLNYKIGRSYQVENRLKSLQTSNASKLILVDKYQCKDCRTLEKRVHNHLKDKKLNGEWFCLSVDELNYVIETIVKLLNEIDMKVNTNTCNICKFSTYKNENFQKHLASVTHIHKQKLNDVIISNDDNNIFRCDLCYYESHDKFNYKRHENSNKHKEKVNNALTESIINSKAIQEDASTNEYDCQYCNKKYTTSSNLSKHRKNCSEKKLIDIKYNEQIKVIEQKDEIIKQKNDIINILKTEIEYFKSLVNHKISQ